MTMFRRNGFKSITPTPSQLCCAAVVAAMLLAIAAADAPGVFGTGRRSSLALRAAPNERFPAGTYRVAAGTLVATFKADGKFTVRRPQGDEVVAEGSYTIDQDQIELTETGGGKDGSRTCAEPGKYKWSFDGKALVFAKIEDDCEGRARALTSGPCPAVTPQQ